MKIISVVGARPNFMKIAPFIQAIDSYNATEAVEKFTHILVHTGQHYDVRMSKGFFDALGIPEANINLAVGSGTHAEQVGHTMIAFEKVIRREKPDWVVVVGDVNATCACSITAKKEKIKLAHIEAGLRSRDMSMPEEINRLVTDRLADLLLTPDELSRTNLIDEGVPAERIYFVGNIMIDTLMANSEKAMRLDIRKIFENNLVSENGQRSVIADFSLKRMVLATLHRPSNVDDPNVLVPLVRFFTEELVKQIPLFWIIHPRTEKQLKVFGLWDRVTRTANLVLLKPLGYHELLRLNMVASIMLTDSGGLQEECCMLGTPCLTLRWNTERPVTLRKHGGVSVLVGNDVNRIRCAFREAVHLKRNPARPKLWDGRTAGRIVQALVNASG